MRNLLALLALAILAFAGIGWYLDWYKIKTEPAPAGHHHVNIDFNGTKIRDDSQKGVQRVEEKVQKFLDKKDQGDNKADQNNPGAKPNPTSPRLSVDQETDPSPTAGPELP